jgi:ATP-dependent RNA helicase DDX10/DBP4
VVAATEMPRKKRFFQGASKRSQQEAAEIEELEAAIAAGAPAPGTNPAFATAPSQPSPAALKPGKATKLTSSVGQRASSNAAASTSYASARRFTELPISRYTKEALDAAKYVTMTAIQRAAIPHALAGRDVLGAAKTGSGKTLAFLIPVRSANNRRLAACS